MTGIVALLYLAIGIGCGLIRLSAVAVGIIAMIPAALGVFVANAEGAMPMLVAALTALLVIEGAYFITMLMVARLRDAKPATEAVDARDRIPGDLRLQRKPQIREEP
jgi:hypothetical protein